MSAVPRTMKGLLVTSFGDTSKAVEMKTDLVTPAFDEESDDILVRVHYASIHMGDWKVSKGDMGSMAGMMGFKPPYVPGQDYSGKIVKIGKQAIDSGFAVGDAVFGEVRLGHGTASEYIVVNQSKEHEIYAMPDNLSLLQAAGTQCSLETVYQGLFHYGGGMREGESILILGGSTVGGMYATQIAKNVFRSKHIAVTSSQHDLCKSLGADVVINYKEKEWQTELKDSHFDLVFDVMGGSKSWTDCRSYNVLKPDGKYITMAGDFEADSQMTCCLICCVFCSVLNRKMCTCCCGRQEYYMINQERSQDIEHCIELIKAGKVQIMIDPDSPFKLNDFLSAYEKIEKRCAHGKLIVSLVEEEQEEEAETSNHNDVQEEDEQK